MIINEFIRLGAYRSPATGGIEFHLFDSPPGGLDTRSYGEVTFAPMEGGEGAWHPPSFWLAEHNAQGLMDDLWNAGIRPSDLGDSVGALGATKTHLQDMQRMVFSMFEILLSSNIQDRTIDE